AGTTWMGSLVHEILHDTTSRPHFQPFVEMNIGNRPCASSMSFNGFAHPRVFKTHLGYDFFEDKIQKECLKTIVVMRNPKDVLVSYYHMHKMKHLNSFPGSFHDFFDLFKHKELIFGDPFDSCAKWWQQRSSRNLMIVKYEDIIMDCTDVVRKIANFLGVPLTEKRISEIVQRGSFGAMKEAYTSFSGPIFSNAFFRKGVIGDWMNYFNDEEVEYINNMSKMYFDPIGLSFVDRPVTQ
ncbi:hypothetical protein CAPTEDRAFT_139096, partial [Capitella teleta]